MSVLSIQKCEEIARRVCALLGVNPDEEIQLPSSALLNPDGTPSLQPVPHWTIYAHMVPEEVAWFRAIVEMLYRKRVI